MKCFSDAGVSLDILHFPRYQLNNHAEQQEFDRLLFTFQRHLPLAAAPDLMRFSSYLYQGCAGCVGVLKEWLSSTLRTALETGKHTITQEDLNQHAFERAKILQMAREIEVGEAMLRDPARLDERGSHLVGELQSLMKACFHEQQPVRRRVGERRAKRDKVGM